MNDEVTNAELARRFDAFATDIRSDLTEISRRLDLYVLREVYAAEQKTAEIRLSAMEARMKETDEQRRVERRWFWSAIVIPLGTLVVTVILNLQSGGS